MNEEQEEALAECSIKNSLYIQALLKVLSRKGIITEAEIDQEYTLVKMEFESEDSAKLN